MIIHHMSDGTVRKSIDGVCVPRQLNKVYELAYKKQFKGELQNGNKNKSSDISKK